jgi:predicted HAD superfamily Cof-like phosphohydrolase
MKEPNPLNAVAEFHSTFKHPIEDNPVIPSEQRCKLRVSLIAEELRELEEAIKNKDIVEVADALCDLQYVLSGAILEFGLGGIFKDLFDEVQRSNMSKACKTLQEAERTMDHYDKSEKTHSYFKESDGHFLVYRTSDNKTLKSIDYSPADLKKILHKHLAKI